MKTLAVALAALAIAGCSPAIKCDAEGYIAMQDGASTEDRSEWSIRNMRLATERQDAATGFKEHPRDQLLKAEGCP